MQAASPFNWIEWGLVAFSVGGFVLLFFGIRRYLNRNMEGAGSYFGEVDGTDLAEAEQEELEKAMYPVGFYKNKAGQIIELSKILVEKYRGKVPCDIDKLCELRGVGRKTANLVLSEGFNKPAICVDVHVHRIFNRLGYLKTKNPEETEYTLREKLPQKYWIPINSLLVTHGQNICKPIKPLCSKCPIEKYCDKAL